MNLTNENENITWLKQSPSSSNVSTPTNATQIPLSTNKKSNDLCVENNLIQLTQEDNPIQSLYNNNVVSIEQSIDKIKSEVNSNFQTSNGNLFLEPNNITINPTIYPDSKEWGFLEYTESSKADEEEDEYSSIATTIDASFKPLSIYLHLKSCGVEWPENVISDGTIDPTTATIVGAVRAISLVAEQEKNNNLLKELNNGDTSETNFNSNQFINNDINKTVICNSENKIEDNKQTINNMNDISNVKIINNNANINSLTNNAIESTQNNQNNDIKILTESKNNNLYVQNQLKNENKDIAEKTFTTNNNNIDSVQILNSIFKDNKINEEIVKITISENEANVTKSPIEKKDQKTNIIIKKIDEANNRTDTICTNENNNIHPQNLNLEFNEKTDENQNSANNLPNKKTDIIWITGNSNQNETNTTKPLITNEDQMPNDLLNKINEPNEKTDIICTNENNNENKTNTKKPIITNENQMSNDLLNKINEPNEKTDIIWITENSNQNETNTTKPLITNKDQMPNDLLNKINEPNEKTDIICTNENNNENKTDTIKPLFTNENQMSNDLLNKINEPNEKTDIIWITENTNQNETNTTKPLITNENQMSNDLLNKINEPNEKTDIICTNKNNNENKTDTTKPLFTNENQMSNDLLNKINEPNEKTDIIWITGNSNQNETNTTKPLITNENQMSNDLLNKINEPNENNNENKTDTTKPLFTNENQMSNDLLNKINEPNEKTDIIWITENSNQNETNTKKTLITNENQMSNDLLNKINEPNEKTDIIWITENSNQNETNTEKTLITNEDQMPNDLLNKINEPNEKTDIIWITENSNQNETNTTKPLITNENQMSNDLLNKINEPNEKTDIIWITENSNQNETNTTKPLITNENQMSNDLLNKINEPNEKTDIICTNKNNNENKTDTTKPLITNENQMSNDLLNKINEPNEKTDIIWITKNSNQNETNTTKPLITNKDQKLNNIKNSITNKVFEKTDNVGINENINVKAKFEELPNNKVDNTSINFSNPNISEVNITSEKSDTIESTKISNTKENKSEDLKVHFQLAEKKSTESNESNTKYNEYTNLLDEYELNLQRHTCETLALVDRLCEKSAQQQSNIQECNKSSKLIENNQIFSNLLSDQNFDLDIDSLKINPNLLIDPVDCLMLPSQRLVILDNEAGILLINLTTKSVIRSTDAPQSKITKWRYPKCCTYIPETDHLLVLAECCSLSNKNEEVKCPNETQTVEIPTLESLIKPQPTDFNLFICRFDAKTLKLENRVEAPKFIWNKIISRCQLCYVIETKCIYLAMSTSNDGFLYELNSDCRWTESFNRRGRTFSDLQQFAVVGPVTELLVLETNKKHLLMLSLYDSNVVTQKTIAISEEPNAIAVDDKGAVFAFDRISAHVSQHSRINFERTRNIAVVERAHCRLSARDRLIAVLVRGFKQLKIYKY